MEETKQNNTPEKGTTSKLSYEQLEKIALALQQRVVEAEGKLRTLTFTSVRLEYLFRVLSNSKEFPEDFVSKCVKEIVSLIDLPENEDNLKEDTKE